MSGLSLQSFEDMSIGMELPSLSFEITQDKINQYAEVSGDFNPLHIDEEFAKGTIFKGTIAHGLMTTAFISQAMLKWHWKGWLTGGEMDLSFISPLRPGDIVQIKGEIVEKDEEEKKISVELDVTNQNKDKIIVGKTVTSF